MIDFSRPTAHPRAQFFKRAAIAGLGLYLLLLAYLSLVPVVPGAQEVSDKVLHFIAYGGLTGLLAAALPRASLMSIFIGVSLVGALLEVSQGLLNLGRMASFADQLANMGGALVALLIWAVLALLRDQLRRKRSSHQAKK